MATRPNLGKTILLLEDEPMVMAVLRLVLKSKGFSLLEATTVEQTLQCFGEYATDIDLLIADVVLPDGSGIHTTLELLSRSQKLKTIFTSGYPPSMWKDQDAADLKAMPPDSISVLQKPFLPAMLLEMVVTLIGPPAQNIPPRGLPQKERSEIHSADPRGKTILLAEDHEGFRYAVATHLRHQGYQVIEALHGLDALHRGRDYFGSIDVLVTDLSMPHLTGKGVAEALRVQRPQLPVVFLTGESIENVKDGLGPLTGYLQKPCELADVVLKIEELLDSAKADAAEA